MYRDHTQSQIADTISVYSGAAARSGSYDTALIEEFSRQPSTERLIAILMDRGVPKATKKALMTGLETSVNYTSVSKFLGDEAMLRCLLRNIPLNSVRDASDAVAIANYVLTKSGNTAVYSQRQVADVHALLDARGIPHEISGSGGSDYKWEAGQPGADGRLWPGTPQEVLLYLRYGSSEGGNQNDRYRGMFSMAKSHPAYRFIFVCDGPEAVLLYGTARDCLADGYGYPNAVWLTLQMLSKLDFEAVKSAGNPAFLDRQGRRANLGLFPDDGLGEFQPASDTEF